VLFENNSSQAFDFTSSLFCAEPGFFGGLCRFCSDSFLAHDQRMVEKKGQLPNRELFVLPLASRLLDNNSYVTG